MDKPDKGETLFSVVFVSIVIGEIAVVGAALWRASGWKLLFVVMALLLFISLSSYGFAVSLLFTALLVIYAVMVRALCGEYRKSIGGARHE